MPKERKAVVTTLSGPLRRLSRTNAPSTNARFCSRLRMRDGGIRKHTEKRTDGLFREKTGPLRLNSDKAVCGTAGALLLELAKALLPESGEFPGTALQKSANPFRAF